MNSNKKNIKKIDNIIFNLLILKNKRPVNKLKESDIKYLCDESIKLLNVESTLLKLNSDIYIAGDIHGQYYDLIKIFKHIGTPAKKKYLFLGDYVDRGIYSIETYSLLLALKIKYPENIYIIRGNHESDWLNETYGFKRECIKKYNYKVWTYFTNTFNYLSLAALIDNKIFCIHGGLSARLNKINGIKTVKKPYRIEEKDSLVTDLVWNDPDDKIDGYKPNSDRGIGFLFGKNSVTRFMSNNNIDLICRAHEVVDEGYKFMFNNKLVTIFSAPHYCNNYDNKGAIMYVNLKLECNFIIFNPVKNVANEKQNEKLYSKNVRRTVKSLSRPASVKKIKERSKSLDKNFTLKKTK